MTLKEIYQLAIKMGRAADPRGVDRVTEILDQEKRNYKELPTSKKPYYDIEQLTNPYPDTRILFGKPDTKVKKLMVGIDIGPAEILLAHELKKSGQKIDAVLSHHPEGLALAQLDSQLMLQTDLLSEYGVPVHIAEALLEKRIAELGRSLSPLNHNRTVDTARMLNIPLLCAHTATDNLVYSYLKKFVLSKKPKVVDDIAKILMELPEYQTASKVAAGPKIFAGNGKRRCGIIAFTEVTGGTSGAKEIYQHLSQHGIGTVVGMHMKEEHKQAAEEAHLNVVIAGHMSSDSLGVNLLMDELESNEVGIIPISGFIRVKRKNPNIEIRISKQSKIRNPKSKMQK